MTETRRALAAMIDHTLLTPEATADDVAALCEEARELGVCAVCISPTMVALASDRLRGSPVKVASVIGFPSGAHRSEVKACEAARASADGADEADMVINLGLALPGDWDGVRADITAVREVLTGGQILKVIIETAVLTPSQITAACHAAETAGADFVKSSTGFHPAGGATREAIRIMAAWHAAVIWLGVNTAVSMMTFKICPSVRTSRTAVMSALTPSQSPGSASPKLMTMSASSAPSALARAASSAFTSLRWAPAGKPITEATLTGEPRSRSEATATTPAAAARGTESAR